MHQLLKVMLTRMNNKKYSLGLSSFSLLRPETEIAAQVLGECRSIEEARERIKKENLFQRVRKSTNKVVVNEVLKRLSHADEWERNLLSGAESSDDSGFICMLLVSRQYPVLLDFVVELVLYKFEGRDTRLESYEMESWFAVKAETHDEISKLKPGSLKRLLVNTRRVLIEGGILLESGEAVYTIRQPLVGLHIQNHYEASGRPEDLYMLLYPEYKIQKIVGNRE